MSALWLVVGFAVGFFSNWAVTRDRPGDEPSTGTPREMVMVAIAVNHVSQNEIIMEDDVTLAPIPKDLMIEEMITDLDQVVGRTAKVDIERGMFITEGFLVEEGD